MIRKKKTGFSNPLGTAAALVRNTWVTRRPYLVYYKPTARCDLRCEICSRWKDDSPSEEELSLDRIESFLSTFRKNGAQILVLWGGEPTLRKDLSEILALGKRLGYRISMCTNMNSLVKKAERLLYNLDTLLCSLDGYGAQHDEARGLEGLFDRAVRGMEKATEYDHLRIKIWTVLSRNNTDSIEPLARLARDLGVWIEFFPVSLIEGYNEELILEGERLHDAFDRIERLKREGYPIWNMTHVLRKMGEGREIRCNFGSVGMHVDHRGEVSCCEDPEGNPLHPWGNLSDIDLDALIRSPQRRRAGLNLRSCQKCRFPCAAELGDSLPVAYAGMFWQSVT